MAVEHSRWPMFVAALEVLPAYTVAYTALDTVAAYTAPYTLAAYTAPYTVAAWYSHKCLFDACTLL